MARKTSGATPIHPRSTPPLVSNLVHSSFENRDRDSIAWTEAAEGRSQTYATVCVYAACLTKNLFCNVHCLGKWEETAGNMNGETELYKTRKLDRDKELIRFSRPLLYIN